MASKSKRSEHLVALKCSVCGRRNYYTSRNKKKIEKKLELKKFCRWCGKNTLHKETKITGK